MSLKKIEVLDGLKYYVHIWKSPSNLVSISSYIWILFVNQSHALVDSVFMNTIESKACIVFADIHELIACIVFADIHELMLYANAYDIILCGYAFSKFAQFMLNLEVLNFSVH